MSPPPLPASPALPQRRKDGRAGDKNDVPRWTSLLLADQMICGISPSWTFGYGPMPRRRRRRSVALGRMIVEAYRNGEPLPALRKRFDICRHLIRRWIEKYELGAFDDEHVWTDPVPECQARIAALALGRKQAREIEFPKGARGLTVKRPVFAGG